MAHNTYKITSNPAAHPNLVYFVNAVSEQDALLTLNELNILVNEVREVEQGVSPKGHHLIVSTKSRESATKSIKELDAARELDAAKVPDVWTLNPDDFKGTQAHAILAGNMHMPGDEEEIPVIRNLLAAAHREGMEARKVWDEAQNTATKASDRLNRAGDYIKRTLAYLELTVNDIAKKEARS